MVTIAAAARTHTGRVRKANEDSVLVAERFVAVADGLGGHAAGEVASRIAVDRLGTLDDRRPAYPEDVLAAVVEANAEIIDQVQRFPEYEGMGTTVTGLGVVDVEGIEQCVIFNVGDSRVYRFADGELTQVTVDHSEVEELVASGAISREDAARYPRRNVVTRCLGSLPSPTPDLWVFEPAGGERFVVCSDGLTNEVDDTLMAELLARHGVLDDAAAALVDHALEAGGRDNVSVVVVEVGVEPAAPPATDAADGEVAEVPPGADIDTTPRAPSPQG